MSEGRSVASVEQDKNGRYQRSAVFIDRKFQTRYMLLIAGTALLIIAVLGVMYAGVLADQRELVGIRALSTGAAVNSDDEQFDRQMSRMVESEDDVRLAVLFVSALALVGLLSWVAIRMTFRVVGPIKAASCMLRGIASGDDSCIRNFRKGDEFMFLSRDIIQLRDIVRDRESEMKKLLASASDEIEKAGGNPEVVGEIRSFLERDVDRFAGRKQED